MYQSVDRTPLGRKGASRLQGSSPMDSGKEGTETKGKSSAAAHCSPGHKSSGYP